MENLDFKITLPACTEESEHDYVNANPKPDQVRINAIIRFFRYAFNPFRYIHRSTRFAFRINSNSQNFYSLDVVGLQLTMKFSLDGFGCKRRYIPYMIDSMDNHE